ncbi:hypothetical protein KVR01_001462 [Diaporthe batatas]|uniref:uncharacterized protein n=1 Tax=Diaporthe batatas TaxID=748121 RepID=UPI001D04F3DF|nr:uncharacterized protein KVR01_001462 [Diaporthe batatas]KAG8168713.1 hypothetical protein KVR01_001462 [Diaporthe batatas]
MMTSILTKLRRLRFRPAGGLSSQLGCLVVDHRGPKVVVRSWATHQQMRSLTSGTGGLDYEDPGHYATLGLQPSASPEEIKAAWTKLNFDLHPDRTGKKSKDDADRLLKVQAAYEILRYPQRKAEYDARHGYNRPVQPDAAAKQQSAAGTRRGGIGLRASLRRMAVKFWEQQQLKEARDRLAANAAAKVQAAEAKRRDEALKAKQLANRAAARAKADREAQEQADMKKADKKKADKKKADKEDPAIRAAEIAEKQKADKEAAARREAAAQAKKAELAKQRERGARLVVIRPVPDTATAYDFAQSLESIKAGRILYLGCERGIAWVELPTAEQARTLHGFITETGAFPIGGMWIGTAELRQGIVPPPQGPELITRCLRIVMPAEFLRMLQPDEDLNSLIKRKLRERGFYISIIGFSWGSTRDGMWIIRDHFSVAHAQSTKAAIEKYYPQLEVTYAEDPCAGLPKTTREDAVKASGSDKKKPRFDLSPASLLFEVAFALVFYSVIYAIGAAGTDVEKGKSLDDKNQ